MAMAPGGEGRVQERIGGILQMWGKDLVNQGAPHIIQGALEAVFSPTNLASSLGIIWKGLGMKSASYSSNLYITLVDWPQYATIYR